MELTPDTTNVPINTPSPAFDLKKAVLAMVKAEPDVYTHTLAQLIWMNHKESTGYQTPADLNQAIDRLAKELIQSGELLGKYDPNVESYWLRFPGQGRPKRIKPSKEDVQQWVQNAVHDFFQESGDPKPGGEHDALTLFQETYGLSPKGARKLWEMSERAANRSA